MWMAGRAILTETAPTCCAVSRGRNARRGECSIRTIRAAALAALAVTTALFLFFRFTRTGTAIRACADNLVGAAVVGLDVKRLYALTFGIGSACVGAAGALMILLTDVTPMVAPAYTLLAFTIVIIGGLGSPAGALVGGVLIGVSEALAGFFLVSSMKAMFSFGLLILVLLFRPQGLFGRRP